VKVQLTRNLGRDWQRLAGLTEGSECEVSAAEGDRLEAAGLCVVLERDKPPEPQKAASEMQDEPDKPKAEPAPAKARENQQPIKKGR